MAQLKLAQLFFEGKVFHRRQQKSREFIHGMARRSGNAAIHVHIIDFLFSFFTPKRAAKRKTEQKWWNSSTTVSLITRSTSRCSGAVPVSCLPRQIISLTRHVTEAGEREHRLWHYRLPTVVRLSISSMALVRIENQFPQMEIFRFDRVEKEEKQIFAEIIFTLIKSLCSSKVRVWLSLSSPCAVHSIAQKRDFRFSQFASRLPARPIAEYFYKWNYITIKKSFSRFLLFGGLLLFEFWNIYSFHAPVSMYTA